MTDARTIQTLIRLGITVFIGLLLAVLWLGWRWTATHQAPALSAASHVVLALAGLSGVFAIVEIWRTRR